MFLHSACSFAPWIFLPGKQGAATVCISFRTMVPACYWSGHQASLVVYVSNGS